MSGISLEEDRSLGPSHRSGSLASAEISNKTMDHGRSRFLTFPRPPNSPRCPLSRCPLAQVADVGCSLGVTFPAALLHPGPRAGSHSLGRPRGPGAPGAGHRKGGDVPEPSISYPITCNTGGLGGAPRNPPVLHV